MKILDYEFKNSNLIKRALTHSSFSKDNYERLEYLGDSIIDFIVAEYFYLKTDEKEGRLTKLRSVFVSEKYLSCVFDNLNLYEKVVLGKSYKGEISAAIKADIVEAIIAGVYLDCKDICFVRNLVVNILNLENYKKFTLSDYKTQLQEYVQAKNKKVTYKLIKKDGLSHDPVWLMGVYLDNQLIGQGQGSSKNKAEQIAAKQALELLKGE